MRAKSWSVLIGATIVTLFIALCAPSMAANATKVNKAIEPTTAGRVIGRVYDADTGRPIKDAAVTIQKNGEFADKGTTVGKTDEAGKYLCYGLIGRTSGSVNALALVALVAFHVGPGISNQTSRIDTTRLAVRVTKEGYRPFEGVVSFRSDDAQKFEVTMQPILLTGAKSAQVSTAADNWRSTGILSVTLDGPIARPRDKVTVTARVRCPFTGKRDDITVMCASAMWKNKELMPDTKSAPDSDGAIVYSASFDAPKSNTARIEPVRVFIKESPYDLLEGGESRTALFQVVTSTTDDEAARKRLEAWRLREIEDNAKAKDILADLCAKPAPAVEDFSALAEVSESVHDYDTAATAYKRVVDLTPAKNQMPQMGRHARALVQSGRQEEALGTYLAKIQAVKHEKLTKDVPLSLMVALGSAQLSAGRLQEADALSRDLIRWPESNGNADVDAFRMALRQAQAEAEIQANPDSSTAWANFGRSLIDQGRWEEAVEKLDKAAKLGPTQPAIQTDLEYALLHIPGRRKEADSLSTAIDAARQSVVSVNGKDKIKSKDFFAWHTLGMLLYKQYCALQEANDPAAAAVLAECRESLSEGLMCGRQGKKETMYSGGSFRVGMISGTQGEIAGFAYPEADMDFLFLQSLKTLDRTPDDYLASYTLASALHGVGQPEMAVRPLARCLALRPDFTEGKYLAGLICMQTGKSEAALTLFKEVLTENPRHAQANLTLAQLQMDEGDTVGAAACMAAHAKYYGRIR